MTSEIIAPSQFFPVEFLPLIIGIIGIIIVFLLYRWILKQPAGAGKTKEIASYIERASWAFIRREWITIVVFIVILAILFALFVENGLFVAIAFVIGSVASLGAVSFGMIAATKANVRTTEAARKDPGLALVLAYRGGAITGIGIVSLALIFLSILYLAYGRSVELLHAIAGFGVGASLAALFSQLGGGIYTKSADVGADLTGKVVLGLPEDDPRNPAVIADLTGDIVGDCVGRGSDLFESFSDNIIGGMLLGIIFYFWMGWYAIIIPLLLQAVGLIASIIGVASIGKSKAPTKRVFLSFIITAVISIIGFAIVGYILPMYLPAELTRPIGVSSSLQIGYEKIGLVFTICGILGLLVSLLVALIVIYYTDPNMPPVKRMAENAEKGAAVNIITGLGYGFESGGVPLLVVAIISVCAFIVGHAIIGNDWGGILGIAAAAMGILSTTGIIQTSDSFGPIVDNADGIAEMGGVSDEVKEATDVLDAVGNTTKQITKAYAMCCAVLTTFLLLFAFLSELLFLKGPEVLGVSNMAEILNMGLSSLIKGLIDKGIISGILHPYTIVGFILGAIVPFVFSAWAIRAVADGASEVVKEVKFQVEHYKILEGGKPDYARCVDIVTKYGLKRMIAPTVLGLIVPPIVGFLLGVGPLIAYLISVNIVSAALATFMFNTGGALDNAKKVAKQMFGSHSDPHKAAIIGDTVGDPLKDTAGPSLHILIKLESILAITLLPLLL